MIGIYGEFNGRAILLLCLEILCRGGCVVILVPQDLLYGRTRMLLLQAGSFGWLKNYTGGNHLTFSSPKCNSKGNDSKRPSHALLTLAFRWSLCYVAHSTRCRRKI